MKKLKTLGILGGMGPEATIFFYQKIIKATKAKKDQDHIPTLIYSNPKIPDRTSCILKGKHQKIIKELQRSAKVLEKAGASLITIPCNTSHYYLQEIKSSVKIPVLDMILETAQYIKEKHSQEKIALLATLGTLQTKIYQKKFKPLGINLVTPEEKEQKKVMEVIYSIKSSHPSLELREKIEKVMERMERKKEVSLFILGCTELPLLFPSEKKEKFKIIDPMDILAQVAVKKLT